MKRLGLRPPSGPGPGAQARGRDTGPGPLIAPEAPDSLAPNQTLVVLPCARLGDPDLDLSRGGLIDTYWYGGAVFKREEQVRRHESRRGCPNTHAEN